MQACRLARGSQDEEGSRGVGRGECLLLARLSTRSPGLGAGERRPHPRRGPVTRHPLAASLARSRVGRQGYGVQLLLTPDSFEC